MLHLPGRADDTTARDVGQMSGLPTEQRMFLDKLLEAPGIRVSAGVFQPGARTAWHVHGIGQLFLIEHGRGVVATRDAVSIARPGDLIYSPGGEEHWHGADPTSIFTYTVISLGDTTFIDEPVDDAMYLAAFAR